MPKGFPRSTNNDHILACALLEKQRARCGKSAAMPDKTEVVLVTHDKALQCKAYANGLSVHKSISEFREMYHSLGKTVKEDKTADTHRELSKQKHEVSTSCASTSRNVTGVAPHGKAEVIELLSDSSGDDAEVTVFELSSDDDSKAEIEASPLGTNGNDGGRRENEEDELNAQESVSWLPQTATKQGDKDMGQEEKNKDVQKDDCLFFIDREGARRDAEQDVVHDRTCDTASKITDTTFGHSFQVG